MNKNYKYILDRSSKKFNCPNCHKKSFVKYIDNETNLYLDPTIGRCDRERKCGYFKKPNNNTISNICITNHNTIALPPTYHNQNVLQKYCNTRQQSNFVTYLYRHFPQQDVLNVVKKYHIGTTNYWYGATIFWQIDDSQNIRSGKIMQYNSIAGKRIKEPFNHVYWMHKQLNLPNFVLQQCLFGLHLINTISKTDIIGVVESEKTAITMSLLIPNLLWLATGSKTHFKEKILIPIKDYKIIAFPDKTEYVDWNKTAQYLKAKGFQISCSEFLENLEVENGGDLIDFLSLN
ncbi:hypothetical protein DUT90_01935 [Polaribacter sp. WD7]|uniref:DUF6371 domain-containing protein n=1 Tax=Polaribacter sp. WD7 TaxID=2269061 RepID=UPI000DF34EB2|nr:DUF6371 domain-containing protein [Polaribacter sp. WD7]RCS28091.1 hypothetical protein DUT90_01935 [Polaribacter sp. WD7]